MREKGIVTVVDPGVDKPLFEAGTLMCVHCGGHWIPQAGSGKTRGYCMNCAGPVCGPCCAACVPTEQYLENLEKGRPEDFRPIMVPVSFSAEG